MRRYPPLIRILFYLLLTIVAIYSLIAAKNFLIPVFLAVLFAYLIYPVAHKMEAWGFPRILTNLMCIIFTLALVGSVVFLMASLTSGFLKDLPDLRVQLMKNINKLQDIMQDKLGISPAIQERMIRNTSNSIFEMSADYMKDIFTATAGTVVKFFLLPVYIFFLLYYRNKFYQFIMKIVPDDQHGKARRIISSFREVTPRYLGGLLIVVMILTILNSTGLIIIGIKHAVFFGVLAALLNIIPYFGTIIGYLIILSFSLISAETMGQSVGVIILFFIIQFTENNILTPNITGSKVQINPFIIILTLIIAGMIWGIAGMFLAIPFLAMFKIFCQNIPELQPYAFLLGTSGTEKHSITWKGIKEKWKKWREK